MSTPTVRAITDDELASLSEFTFLRENAKQADATGPLPTVERIDSGAVSALKFGDAAEIPADIAGEAIMEALSGGKSSKAERRARRMAEISSFGLSTSASIPRRVRTGSDNVTTLAERGTTAPPGESSSGS